MNRIQLMKRNILPKQLYMESPEGHWDKIFELEKKCAFSNFSIELLISNFLTSITDRTLGEELLKKDSDVPKLVNQIQPIT